MSQQPDWLCASCGRPLRIIWEDETNDFYIYCGFGKCPSRKANEGETGQTPEIASMNLTKAIEAEQEQQASD
jgi:hypothetical protein